MHLHPSSSSTPQCDDEHITAKCQNPVQKIQKLLELVPSSFFLLLLLAHVSMFESASQRVSQALEPSKNI